MPKECSGIVSCMLNICIPLAITSPRDVTHMVIFRNQEALVSIGKELAHLLINGRTRNATLMLSVDNVVFPFRSDVTMFNVTHNKKDTI